MVAAPPGRSLFGRPRARSWRCPRRPEMGTGIWPRRCLSDPLVSDGPRFPKPKETTARSYERRSTARSTKRSGTRSGRGPYTTRRAAALPSCRRAHKAGRPTPSPATSKPYTGSEASNRSRHRRAGRRVAGSCRQFIRGATATSTDLGRLDPDKERGQAPHFQGAHPRSHRQWAERGGHNGHTAPISQRRIPFIFPSVRNSVWERPVLESRFPSSAGNSRETEFRKTCVPKRSSGTRMEGGGLQQPELQPDQSCTREHFRHFAVSKEDRHLPPPVDEATGPFAPIAIQIIDAPAVAQSPCGWRVQVKPSDRMNRSASSTGVSRGTRSWINPTIRSGSEIPLVRGREARQPGIKTTAAVKITVRRIQPPSRRADQLLDRM